MIDCKVKFSELLGELEQVHPDLYRKSSKEDLEEFIEKCPEKCTNNEFILNLLRLTSIIGDPHTVPVFNI